MKQAGDMLEKAYAQSLEFNGLWAKFADITNSLIMVYKPLKDYPISVRVEMRTGTERIIQNEILAGN